MDRDTTQGADVPNEPATGPRRPEPSRVWERLCQQWDGLRAVWAESQERLAESQERLAESQTQSARVRDDRE